MPTHTSAGTQQLETIEALHDLVRSLLSGLEEIRTAALQANQEARERWHYPELGEGSYYALAIEGDWPSAAVAAALERLPETLDEAIEQLRDALDVDPETARMHVLPLLVSAWEDRMADLGTAVREGGEG